MLNKGALTLLADYGGDSSDDDISSPGVSVKRLYESDEEQFNVKKMQR